MANRFVQPLFIVDGSAQFNGQVSLEASIYIKGPAYITSPPASTTGDNALILENIGPDERIRYRQLGTMAFEASSNYYTAAETDGIFLSESSLGTSFYWDSGILDVSIAPSTLVEAWNGLSFTDNSLGLGGSLTKATTITTDGTNTLALAGLQTGTTRLAIISNSGVLETQQLGTMSLEASSNYYTTGEIDGLLGDLDASINDLYDITDVLEASVVRLDSSLNYILSNALLTASNGLTVVGQDVQLGGSLSGDTDINSNGNTLSITGGLAIYGTLSVDGSVTYINSVDLNVSDNIITVNYGETGAGVSKGFAGIKIDRGSEDSYVFVFAEATGTFRVGTSASEGGLPDGTQAVATREDSPTAFGVPFWNGGQFRYDTSIGFIFTPGSGLSLPIASNDANESTSLMITPAGLIVSRELGSNAFDSSVYVLRTQFDSSITSIWTKLGNIDTSLNNIWTKFGHVDTSLNSIWTKFGHVDTSLNSIWTKLGNVDTSLNDIWTKFGHVDTSLNSIWTEIGYLETSIGTLDSIKLNDVANINVVGDASVYSYTDSKVAYLKKIVAGTGATITEDTSTITIAVSGAAGYVNKYTGAFDGTTGTTLTVLAATHGLGTGPFTVSVYDSGNLVYPDISYNGSGDITLLWVGGSLSASCAYIIMG